jgi:hypothetical protein
MENAEAIRMMSQRGKPQTGERRREKGEGPKMGCSLSFSFLPAPFSNGCVIWCGPKLELLTTRSPIQGF